MVHHQSWTLIKTSLRYPAVVLSHGSPAAMGPKDSPFMLSVLWEVIDRVDVGVGQFKALDMGLDGN